MTATASLLPLAAVLLPALAVGPILATRHRPNVREAWTFLAGGGTLVLAGLLARAVLAGARPTTDLGTYVGGVGFVLRVDPFGTLFGLLAATLWLVTSVYSVGYMRGLDEHGQGRYFAAFAASIAATLGVAFAGNLLTLFVAYELLTVATYPLVVHAGTDDARAAGRQYLAYTLAGGAAVFAGLVLVYLLAGSVAFVPGGLAGVASDPALARVAFGLLVLGFGVKTAVVPLHTWLPNAMVAPTPVSGLLHAVAVVKSGAFGLGRVVAYVFGPDAVTGLGVGLPLAVLAATTMLYAGVLALRREKLKQALAYSTVSQLSYIALGFALAGRLSTFGAILHIPAHAFMKITLFFVAGLVYVETGATYRDELAGIARRLPVTMTAFAVAAAGLAGFPLVAGFVSKWYMVLGALATDPGFGAVYLLAGGLKLLLFWPIVASAFFTDPEEAEDPAHDAAAAPHGGAPVASDGGSATPGDGTDGPAEAPGDGTSGPSGDLGGDDPAGDDYHAGHGSLPPAGGWTRPASFREAPPALLGPVVAVAVGAVVLGVVPDWLPLWDLAEATVAEVFGP
ncbi:complex I subunit 5 family protein [Haloglomus litoreum]|uniref:complex I subunit 5 family protein n=1 Tax=Haloglomus litoreum TaxID=3034026 RepID=UPI0023E86400|nr:proton-conducting transporter membrane subunit [Haloglomus sp. DT116]